MLLGVYTLYDSVMKMSGPLFTAHNEGDAVRQCRRLFEDAKVKPEDFVLYSMGLYDDEQLILTATKKIAVKIPQEVKK